MGFVEKTKKLTIWVVGKANPVVRLLLAWTCPCLEHNWDHHHWHLHSPDAKTRKC